MKLVVILLCIMVQTGPISAQSIKAVIVQINTNQNKVSYFIKAGNTKEAERIVLESADMAKKMIADLTDNFTYCPVYYCIDSNIDFIRKKQFNNILLNAYGATVKDPIITAADSDYLIIRYGYPDNNTSIRNAKGFVVYSSDFTNLFFVHKLMTDKKDEKYVYTSDKYDIEYNPLAKELAHKIKKKLEN